MTPDQVGQIVLRIIGSWPVQLVNVDKRAMTIAYSEGLLDLEYHAALHAVQELARTELMPPAIATIRARVVARNHGEQRSGIEAWGDVVKIGGAYFDRPASDVFTDAAALACAHELGWIVGHWVTIHGRERLRWRICRSADDEASDRARFVELYEKTTSREYRAAQILPGATSPSLPRAEEQRRVGGLLQRYLPSKTEESK